LFVKKAKDSFNLTFECKKYIFKVYIREVKLDTAKIFKNGKSQAIRIPKAYRLKGKEANITQIGDALIILPKKDAWDTFLDGLNGFSEDFLTERIQPKNDERENIFK
jgi:antitoxin VapB